MREGYRQEELPVDKDKFGIKLFYHFLYADCLGGDRVYEQAFGRSEVDHALATGTEIGGACRVRGEGRLNV
ncbi:hypothetical protein C1I95_20160 [Micromonospora craterilacus]|uniref:Uncharacterized protein n=1 Tax=Micromonospora craterilacus TaxID=1655439 RepID=A0A2W2DT96_9ACTN|nr:hypothetical protein C1I95_20160 [Micromonospora craterilacus]